MKTKFNLIQFCLLCVVASQAFTSSAQIVNNVAAGYEASLFLKSDGGLWTMGYNQYGQLGDGTYNNTNRPERIVAGNVTTIAEGLWGGLIVKNDGSLWDWGYNYFNELGDGTDNNSNLPEQIEASGVTAVAAGGYHNLFLMSNGSLWAMGYNGFGQLGDGTTDDADFPEQIVPSGVTAIAAGGQHSLFLLSNGSLWAMGDNAYGQLGDGTTNNADQPEQIVAGGVTAISAGNDHSLFLKSDGSLWGMGLNNQGELGDGTTNNVSLPEQISAISPVAISAGGVFSLFLDSDGSLWATGDNGFGQLGDGTFSSIDSPKQIVASGVTGISAGYYYSLFIKADGSLWGMGDNSRGQLGLGNYSSNPPYGFNRPVEIVGPPGAQIPVLGITNNPTTGVSVYWPVTAAGFSLEWTPTLAPPILWQPYPVTPSLSADGSTWVVNLASLQTTNPAAYFQLISSSGGATAPTAPTVVTAAAFLITSSGASLSGTVLPNGLDTTWWFQWGTNTSYGNTTGSAVVAATETNAVGVDFQLSGLMPATLYHFQLYGSNAAGTSLGGDLTFTTAAAATPPALVTLAATSIGSSSAVLNGTIDGNGSEAVAHFEYGTDTSYTGGQVGTYFTSENGDVESFSYTLTGLMPSTTYHYQAFGFNCCLEGFGGDATFTTLPLPPTVLTLAASSITINSATINGSINPNGPTATAYFQYSTSPFGPFQGGIAATPSYYASGNYLQDYAYNLTGLTPNTTYYFIFEAFNTLSANGALLSFTTAWVPVPPTLIAPGSSTPGQVTVSSLTPTFSWNASSQATSSDIIIDKYPSGTFVNAFAVGTISSFQLPSGYLQSGTAYSWYMISFNILGDQSAPSSTYYFKTP